MFNNTYINSLEKEVDIWISSLAYNLSNKMELILIVC